MQHLTHEPVNKTGTPMIWVNPYLNDLHPVAQVHAGNHPDAPSVFEREPGGTWMLPEIPARLPSPEVRRALFRIDQRCRERFWSIRERCEACRPQKTLLTGADQSH